MDYSARDESGSNPVSGWQYYTDPVRLSKALDSVREKALVAILAEHNPVIEYHC